MDIGSESYNHRTRDYVYGQRDGQIDKRVPRTVQFNIRPN